MRPKGPKGGQLAFFSLSMTPDWCRIDGSLSPPTYGPISDGQMPSGVAIAWNFIPGIFSWPEKHDSRFSRVFANGRNVPSMYPHIVDKLWPERRAEAAAKSSRRS